MLTTEAPGSRDKNAIPAKAEIQETGCPESFRDTMVVISLCIALNDLIVCCLSPCLCVSVVL